MKWICPNCPELMHGTRHESVVRHINRKHQSVGQPISLNRGLTRIQMGIKSDLQAPYARGPKRLLPYPPFHNTSSQLDLYDWTENQVLRPMRQLLELKNLRHQLEARNVRDFQNMAQSNMSSYACDEQLKIITKNLFGCRVFLCENCFSLEIQPFYFCDPPLPQSESTIIEHSCPSKSYTMLKCIPDNEKMIFRDYMKQSDLVYMLKYCALNQWSKNGSLYLHAIKVPYSYINCVNILDPTAQGKRSFVVEYSPEHTIGLNILKDHWVSKVIGRERINEITIYEKELSEFLTVAHYTTFGFFRIQTSGEIYFIMLTPHSYLNMNLVDRSKDGLPKYIC